MSNDLSMGKPLQDKTVMVACSAKKMSALADGLRTAGAQVLPFPVIQIREIEDKHPLDNALASLNKYAWIVFTSSYGADFFTQRFRDLQISRDVLTGVKICSIGPGTARSLQENGFEPDLVPEQFVAEGVLDALGAYCGGLQSLSGRHILFPRAKDARDVLPDALRAAGAHVDIVVCYQTVRAEMSEETIHRFGSLNPDLIVFTSSSTVKNTMETLGHAVGKKLLEKSAVAAIGPITTATIESFGKNVDIVPMESTIASLIQAIIQWAVGSKL